MFPGICPSSDLPLIELILRPVSISIEGVDVPLIPPHPSPGASLPNLERSLDMIDLVQHAAALMKEFDVVKL